MSSYRDQFIWILILAGDLLNYLNLKFYNMSLEYLTKDTFKTKIFNYEENKDWKYEGIRPAIIDFYADWCGPCKMIAPILDELHKEYEGKLDIYKVNTEEENELSEMFGIQSIPSLLFIPVTGQPQMAKGAIPKETFIQAISDIFNIK